jgi:NAD(P)-dependent dehydrogenase (short-subunit alcohol dehydrogenase family)
LILPVRSLAKGQEAKEYILRNNPHRSEPGAIEIWSLDLSSTKSTLAFANRVKTDLPRLDILLNNAGINSEWKVYEGHEQAVQVNVLNTFLLSLSLLPKLEATSATLTAKEPRPHLVIVSSEAHRLTKFPEINAPELYAKLKDKSYFSQQARSVFFIHLHVRVNWIRVTKLSFLTIDTKPLSSWKCSSHVNLSLASVPLPA